MERPITSLWWSGVAAGLSISFSLLVLPARAGDSPGAFARHLMAAAAHQPWVPGRIFDRRPGMPTALYGKHHHSGTAPRRQFHGGQFGEAGSVVDNRLRRQYDRDSRSRSVLYVAAGSCPRAARRNDRHQPTYPPDELDRVFFRAISAGFLIAAMVWLIPSGEAAAFHVIAMMTYLIGIGGFLHIYCRQRRSLFAGCQRAARVGGYDGIFCLARPARKYRRRHCALHVDVACPGDERDPNSTGSPPAAAVKL